MSAPNHQHPDRNPAPVTPGAAFNPLTVTDDEPAPTPPPITTPAAPATATPTAAATGAEPGAKTAVATLEQAGPTIPASTPEEPTTVEGDPSDAGQSDSERADRERHEQLAAYAARRRRYTLLIIAVIGFALWHIKPWAGLTLPGLPGASIGGTEPGVHSTTQSARPAEDLVARDMDRVHRRLHRTGDLTDMRLPGAEVASAGKTLYAARAVNGQCVVYGVIDGDDITAQPDPTGQACAGQIATVQAQLDAAAAATRADAAAAAEDRLVDAADTAGFYAGQNYADGTPSLHGLPAGQLDGATIVENHGDWARLRATAAGTCRTAIVAATGDLGEISSC